MTIEDRDKTIQRGTSIQEVLRFNNSMIFIIECLEF